MTEKLLDRQLSLKPFEHHKISLPWYQEGTQRHRSGMLHSDSQFPTIKKNKQQDTRTLMPHTAGTKLENRETETQEFWMQHGPVRLKKTKPHYCIYGVLRQLGKKKNACTSFLRSCMSAMKCFAEKSPKVFEQMYSNYLMAEKQQLNAVFFPSSSACHFIPGCFQRSSDSSPVQRKFLGGVYKRSIILKRKTLSTI